MNKNASELALNTIIVAILALLVLIILVLIFTGGAGKIITKFDSIIQALTG